MDLSWLQNFGLGETQLPDLAGAFSGRLTIAGGGRCVWSDLEGHWNGDVMCVNDIGMHFPGQVRHWYSNDAKMLAKWSAARRPLLVARQERAILHHSCNPGHIHWPWPGHGSSGLNAVYTGLGLGYDEIFLAGMPLDDSGHYFDPPWVKTNFVREVPERYWIRARDHIFKGRVKSLSGRSKEILEG
ncbi:MAG: hypothetical protein ACE5FS_03505 [Paracoccaceae bacterium]